MQSSVYALVVLTALALTSSQDANSQHVCFLVWKQHVLKCHTL